MSLFLIIGTVIAIIIVLFLLVIFIPWKFGAPYDPSSKKEINHMLELSGVKKGDKVVDIGSGDGRLVIEFAKKGAEVHGYEVNPILFRIAKSKIKKAGLSKRAFVHKKDFWKVDLKDFDIITTFQINFIMPKLAKKIKKEGKRNVKVVSNTWKFPKQKPIKRKSHVYLYIFNSD